MAAALLGQEFPPEMHAKSVGYPGEYQSLQAASVSTLDDSSVRAGILGARQALAELGPDSSEYRAQRRNLATLQ